MKLPATTTYSMNDIINEEDEVISIYVAPEAYQDDWDDLDYIPGLEKAMRRSPVSFQRIRKTASAEN